MSTDQELDVARDRIAELTRQRDLMLKTAKQLRPYSGRNQVFVCARPECDNPQCRALREIDAAIEMVEGRNIAVKDSQQPVGLLID